MPLATALRARYPRAELLWAVEPDAAPLLEGHRSGVEPFVVPRAGGLGVRGRAVAGLRSLRPDLVVDSQGNAKSGTVARIAARGAPILGFAKADVREWSNLAFTTVKAPPSREVHAVRRNLGLLRALGAEPPEGPPDYGLAASPDEIDAGRETLRRAGVPAGQSLVLIHPGKLRDLRTWTAEGIAGLAAAAARRGRAVALEGPDPERPAAARTIFAGLFAAGAADLTAGVPLRVLVGLLAHLAEERREKGLGHVLVSPDTLLPHIAAAVGLPVVLLAGPQDPDRTGPVGGTSVVVRAWEGLPCAPCRKRRCHWEEPRACMRNITVEMVDQAVESLAG
jgi:heptosyltransferase-1